MGLRWNHLGSIVPCLRTLGARSPLRPVFVERRLPPVCSASFAWVTELQAELAAHAGLVC
jgi:hypothetical protein